MKAKNLKAAWKLVDEIFPTDYNEDMVASEKAGYKVYRSPLSYYDYICDLGDRLEINLHTGKTINIWIDLDFTESEKKEICGYLDTFLYKMEDNFGFLHDDELMKYGINVVMAKLRVIYQMLGGE